MKRLLALCLAVLVFSCEEEPKDYVTLSGKIENPHESKTLRIFNRQGFEKTIELNEDGTFSDTLKVEAGTFSFNHGEQYGNIYLENDNESSFTTDYENFDDEMKFDGDASDRNNFSVQSFVMSTKHFNDKLISNGTQEDLDKAINDYQTEYEALKKEYKEVDSAEVANMDRNVKTTISQYERYISSKIAIRNEFPEGSKSPKFEDYENFAGGESSLDDLKGKYIYIDIWATWCGPCKAEIPSLKKLEKEFEDNNIQFVSISVDDGRGYKGDANAAKEGWKKMVQDKELGGMQLLADNAWTSDFIRAYKINSIPRFLLIDPEGKIVSADAPRPSNPELKKMFKDLNI